jgi:hypothetical protein
MLSPQESTLLKSLRKAGGPLDGLRLSSLANLRDDHLGRLLADIEWRGLVVVMKAAGGIVAMLTPQGFQLAAG